MSEKTLTLTFCGGAGGVTGSNFLLEGEGIKLLIDCGLFQGCKFCDDDNRKPFLYDPKSISALLITHAHLDHVGRIPRLVSEGFRGPIYSTPATRDIAEAVLGDSLKILREEAAREHLPPLYEEADIRQAFSQWKTVLYHEPLALPGDITCLFRDAGHILGSSIIECAYRGKKVVFTGDLGNSPSPLLNDTEQITDATYLVMESTYGDRNHTERWHREEVLEDIVEDAVMWGGALLIPVFSVERTQTLLYEMNKLVEHGKIPKAPVFVDSPLAVKITAIYRKRIEELNATIRQEVKSGDDIFAFSGLTFTTSAEESRMIEKKPNPKIIVAGSGMSAGGRILGHERHYLEDPKSTVLFIGYQAAGSLGRQIADGARKVTINGEDIKVRARVVRLQGFSAHKDSDGLFEFAAHSADTLKKIFVVMGEPKSSLFLVQRLRDYLGLDVRAPKVGDSVVLEF